MDRLVDRRYVMEKSLGYASEKQVRFALLSNQPDRRIFLAPKNATVQMIVF